MKSLEAEVTSLRQKIRHNEAKQANSEFEKVSDSKAVQQKSLIFSCSLVDQIHRSVSPED